MSHSFFRVPLGDRPDGDRPAESGVPPQGASPTLTYEPFYGLREKAFSLSADPRFLFRSPTHAPAFDELSNGIRRREGLIVLTGEIGTGKSTLIRAVLQQLDRRTFTALVPDPFVSREDLLKMLLVDFGVVSIADLKRGSLAGASRPDLSYPLYEFLDSLVPLQAFAVLIIDEAQHLPLHLLEEIRILSDLEHRERLLQVVLVGQPELRTHLTLPQMRQVDQRVSVRCELAPLDRGDVAAYVRHRLDVASGGRARSLFSDAALDAVYERSGGVPRLVNLICDRALQRGHATGATSINMLLVRDAVERLGFSSAGPDHPGPHATPAASRPAAPAVAVSRPTPAPLQSLAEFTTEREVASPWQRRASAWQLGAAFLVMAAVTAVCTGFWLVSLGPARAAATVTLPPPPAWTSPVAAPATPPPAATLLLAATEPAVAPDGGPYAIQVASFASPERALRSVAELGLAGFLARVVDVGGAGGRWLQVRVEGRGSPEEAARDLARIRGLSGYADAQFLPD